MAHLGHTRLAGGCLLVPTNADVRVEVMVVVVVVYRALSELDAAVVLLVCVVTMEKSVVAVVVSDAVATVTAVVSVRLGRVARRRWEMSMRAQ